MVKVFKKSIKLSYGQCAVYFTKNNGLAKYSS